MSVEHKDPDRAATTGGQRRGRDPSGSLDVLVVEDNPVNRKVVVALLIKWRHRVVVACNGALGLQEFERQDFDLVLMDIQMPVMDGIEATRAIRARERERGGHVSIIAITAHAAALDRVRCIEAGVDSYLTKPLDSELLRQAIAELFPATAHEPNAPSGKVIDGVDFEQLKEFVGDDPALVSEVIQIFLDDAPATLEQAVRAISNADAAALEASAHRLKGSLATMGAAAAAETAHLLETMGREGVLAGAAELCERLSREVGITRESLRLLKVQLAA